MAESTYIEDLGAHQGETITVRGWLYNKRSSGKIAFLQVRDGTGVVQAVVTPGDVDAASWALIEELTQESSILVTGSVRADPRSPTGFELGAERVEVVQMAAEYPISPKEHGTEFLMDHRHLWLRSSRQHASNGSDVSPSAVRSIRSGQPSCRTCRSRSWGSRR